MIVSRDTPPSALQHQQIVAQDARYNNVRCNIPHLKTLYMRRRSQLLRDRPDRSVYQGIRSRLLATKYPSVATPSDLRSNSRTGSMHSRTCSLDSLDVLGQQVVVVQPPTPQSTRKRGAPGSSLSTRSPRPTGEKDVYAFTDMPHIFDQHSKSVYLVLFAHNSSSLLACCAADHVISLCDLSPYGVRTTLVGHEGAVRDMDWSIDNSLLLSAGEDGSARLWKIETGECLRIVSHFAPIRASRFLPMNNNICVTGCGEGVVQGYNLSTGKPLSGARERIGSAITCLVFGPDSSLLWVSNTKGKILSLSVNPLSCQMKKLRANSIPGGGSIVSLSVRSGRPNPLMLVSSTSDLIFMFSIEKDSLLLVRKCPVKLGGLPLKSVFCPLVTANKGAFIVTGSNDGSVLVYDMEKGKAVNKLQGHSCPVYSVCMSHDENTLISADSSGTIIVWQKRDTHT